MLYSVAFRLFTNGSISVQRGSTKIVLMITITFRKNHENWHLKLTETNRMVNTSGFYL